VPPGRADRSATEHPEAGFVIGGRRARLSECLRVARTARQNAGSRTPEGGGVAPGGERGSPHVRSSYKTIGLCVILIALFVCFFHISNRNQEDVQEPTFTALLSKIEEKKVRQVNVRGNTYSGTYEDTKEKFRTIGPPADSVMLQKLRESGVDVKYEKEEQNSF